MNVKETRKAIIGIIQKYQNIIMKRRGRLKDYAFFMELKRDPESYTKTTPQHVQAARKVIEHVKLTVDDTLDDSEILTAGKVQGFIKSFRGEVEPIELASKRDIYPEKYVDALWSSVHQIASVFGITPYDVGDPDVDYHYEKKGEKQMHLQAFIPVEKIE